MLEKLSFSFFPFLTSCRSKQKTKIRKSAEPFPVVIGTYNNFDTFNYDHGPVCHRILELKSIDECQRVPIVSNKSQCNSNRKRKVYGNGKDQYGISIFSDISTKNSANTSAYGSILSFSTDSDEDFDYDDPIITTDTKNSHAMEDSDYGFFEKSTCDSFCLIKKFMQTRDIDDFQEKKYTVQNFSRSTEKYEMAGQS